MTENLFLCREIDEQLKKRIAGLTVHYLVKNREKLISDYIEREMKRFMGEDRLLTSDEVMNMLRISRQTLYRRIKHGILKPVNPDAKRNYRFEKSEVFKCIDKEGGTNV